MRSHSFAALALLCSTSALAACGESVEVGTFEDGTGGAGGGDDVASSGAPSGPASGTGGDDTTTSSSGGDPAADSFRLSLIQDRAGFAAGFTTLGGSFNRGPFVPPSDCTLEATVGSCTLHRCTIADIEHRVNIDAGPVTVTAGDNVLNAAFDSGDGYSGLDDELPFFTASDTVTFAVSGSSEVPALTSQAAAPPALVNAQEAVDATWDPSGDDVTVTWAPKALAHGTVVVARQGVDGVNTFVTCGINGSEGSLAIPGALLTAGSDLPATEVLLSIANETDALQTGTFGGVFSVLEVAAASHKRCGLFGGDGSGDECGDDEYCDYEGDLCGENDGSGVCRPRPKTCEADGPVVCSCDGESYPSACEAAQHGADVWGGEDFCIETTICGGIGGLTCEADQFCDFPNDQCGGDDSTGVCRTRPTDCPEPNADEVLCGCNFDTYGSECLANQAGQDVSLNDPLECGGA